MKSRMEGDVMGSVKMMSLMAPKPVSKQAFQGTITDDDDSDAQAIEREGDFMGSHHDEKRALNMTHALQWVRNGNDLVYKESQWYP